MSIKSDAASRPQRSVLQWLGSDLLVINSPAPFHGRLRSLATNCLRLPMGWMARRWAQRVCVHQLHLGCGGTLLPGWLNVDLVGRRRIDLALDLGRPLPFPDRSVDAIFHEHVLEHLSYSRALSLLAECARVLRRGGVLRIGVPDFGRYIESYAKRTGFIELARPNRLSPLIAVAEVAYGNGHRSVWDGETLTKLLEHLGIDAVPATFGQSRLEPCPDSADREHETLYIEGVKVQ